MEQFTVEDMMAAYAEDPVDFARETFSVELDYSEESIEAVEEILSHLHNSLPKGFFSRLLGSGPSQDTLDSLAKMFGGYVGEVMRRNWGGKWKSRSDAIPDQEVVTLELKGETDVWPHFKAGNRIVKGPEDNVLQYFQVLKKDHGNQ